MHTYIQSILLTMTLLMAWGDYVQAAPKAKTTSKETYGNFCKSNHDALRPYKEMSSTELEMKVQEGDPVAQYAMGKKFEGKD